MKTIKLALWIALLAASAPAARNLDIYTIDVEGGKAVLVVSPSGESMLVDVGWPASPNRPASTDRILEAVKAAGLKQIDYLLITHYDIDHIGDVPALLAKIPARRLLDHGEMMTPDASNPQWKAMVETGRERFAVYKTLREKMPYTLLKPGDRIPIKGVQVDVIASAAKLIQKPVKGAGKANPLCAATKQADLLERDVEDDQSVGLLYTFGKFRMLDLTDVEAHYSHDLACPLDLIGPVDIYHVNVHGQLKGIDAALVGALRAPVLIQGNGARKGADAGSWPILKAAPGLKDIWQVHYSENAGKDGNPPEDFIANPQGPDAFHWIKVSVEPSGAFTVTNGRNGFHQTYQK